MSLNGLGCQVPGTFASSLPVVQRDGNVNIQTVIQREGQILAQRKS